MIAIYNSATGALEQLVDTLDGEDMTGRESMAVPAGYPDDLCWDDASRSFQLHPIGPQQDAARKLIDETVDRWMLEAMSEGPVRALVYAAKQREFFRYQDDPAPAPASYPLAAAEIGVTAETLALVMAAWQVQIEAWTTRTAPLEAYRLSAKQAVGNAQDRASIEAITTTLANPLEA